MKYQKIVVLTLIGLVVAPSVALASWWNPLSWFRKPVTPQPVVEEIKQVAPVVINPEMKSAVILPEVNEKLPVPVTKTKIMIPKVVTPIKQIAPVVSVDAPTVAPVVVPAVVTPPPVVVPQLVISNIKIHTESNSARVDWNTSIDSESKVLLEGKSYISKRGISKSHTVEIYDLESDLLYGGSITAIANNAWNTEKFTFRTKQNPLKISDINHNCNSNNCSITWSTNYITNSRIKIYKDGDSSVYKSLDSRSGKGKEHSVNVSLSQGDYSIRIYATSDTESTEIKDGFAIDKPCFGKVCA